MRNSVRLGVVNHRAELINPEWATVHTDTFLAVDNRSLGGQPNLQRYECQQGRNQHKACSRHHYIKRTLDTLFGVGHVVLGDADERRAVDEADSRRTGHHVIHTRHHTDVAGQRIKACNEGVQFAVGVTGRQIDDNFVLFAGFQCFCFFHRMNDMRATDTAVARQERNGQTRDITEHELQDEQHQQRTKIAMVIGHYIIYDDDKEEYQ